MDGTGKRDRRIGRLLVEIGRVPAAAEPYFPERLRRDFGLRLVGLAVVSLVVAPIVAVAAFDSTVAAFIPAVVAVTGFLGYCEMYRVLDDLRSEVEAAENGDYDVAFDADRLDEVGELYDAFERMAASMGEQIERAEAAREEAEQAQSVRASVDDQSDALEEIAADVSALSDEADRLEAVLEPFDVGAERPAATTAD